MTLAQLRYTIAIAKAGSMNEAAKSLYISQPSLSTAIRELEAETGVEIFRRTNRGIAVTPAGEEFLGYARQVVEQYELMEAKYISKEQSRKKFSVSMQHYTFAVNAFVELVKQFGMDEYEFAVHETKTHQVIEDVRNFKSEIGILYVNDFNRKVLTKMFHEYGLEFHELLNCRIYVYMWKGHPLAKREKITLEELTDEAAASNSGEQEASASAPQEDAGAASAPEGSSASSGSAASRTESSSTASSGKQENAGTANSGTEKPASSSSKQEAAYEKEVKALLQQLYSVKARAEAELNSCIAGAKAEFKSLPESQQTQARKVSIVLARSGRLYAMQASYDKEVASIVSQMRAILTANGQSTALADQAMASYKAQKSAMYSQLTAKLYS